MRKLLQNKLFLFASLPLVCSSICIWEILLSPLLFPIKEAETPVLSPDGQRIAFQCYLEGPRGVGTNNYYDIDASDICMANTDGSNWIRLTANQVADEYPSWSPDGAQLAYVNRRDGIYITNRKGDEQRLLTLTPNLKWYDLDKLVWSPDGKYLAFSACPVDVDQADRDIYVVDVNNGTMTNLTPGNGTLDRAPTWFPNSTQIAFLSSPLPLSDLDDNCFHLTDSSSKLKLISVDGTNERSIYDKEGFHSFKTLTVLPTGRIIFSESIASDVYWYTIKLDEKEPTLWEEIRKFPSWSPDGRYLAYVVYKASNNSITLLDPETHNQRKFPLPRSALIQLLAWSPDGQELALIYKSSVFLLDVETGTERNMTSLPPYHELYSLVWSTDGKRFILEVDERFEPPFKFSDFLDSFDTPYHESYLRKILILDLGTQTMHSLVQE